MQHLHAYVVINLLQCIVCEGCQGGSTAVSHANGVVDALEHSELTQVYLWGLGL